MISSALFISVAESMVIFRPMDQVGWARASSTVTAAKSRLPVPEERPARGGQDDAAHGARRGASAARHWKMALCSLSMGTISAPAAAASRLMSSPAATRVSLLARHSLPLQADGLEGGRQAVGAVDGRDDAVGLGQGDDLLQALGAAEYLACAGNAPAARCASLPRLDADGLRREFGDLFFQQLGVAAGRQAEQAEALAVLAQDGQGAAPDRAGAAEDHDVFYHRLSRRLSLARKRACAYFQK